MGDAASITAFQWDIRSELYTALSIASNVGSKTEESQRVSHWSASHHSFWKSRELHVAIGESF
jgi:hypothetical protein